MPDQSNHKAESIRQMIAAVDSGVALVGEKKEGVLVALEAHECWAPFFRLINRSINDPATRQLSDFTRLARVQNLYLEDVFEAAETCSQAVSALKLSFPQFQEQVVPPVVEAEDYATEATIVQAVADKFVETRDKVLALERLCLLFEKKTFNEAHLNETYSKLLELDPLNVKALRYFKLVFTQNYEWEKVLKVLQSLLQASRHPQDAFRVGQELAAVYLYQLDQARMAIDVIEQHCDGSPLDTSTITYDAYQRLSEWDGCIKVLRECQLGAEDEHDRAILHFKIGQLEERLSRVDEARKSYKNAIGLYPSFLEPYENLIYLEIQSKAWSDVRLWLDNLSSNLLDDGSKIQLDETIACLDKGLRDAEHG